MNATFYLFSTSLVLFIIAACNFNGILSFLKAHDVSLACDVQYLWILRNCFASYLIFELSLVLASTFL